jgi:hypothetical protein
VPLHTIYAWDDIDTPEEQRPEVFVSLVKAVKQHYKLSELELIDEVRGDVGLVKWPQMEQYRNIVSLFVDEMPTFGMFRHLQPEQNSTSWGAREARSVQWGDEKNLHDVEVAGHKDYTPYQTDIEFYGIPNYAGMCGTPYIHEATGKVVAIHMAGKPSTQVAYGVMFTKSDLLKYKDGPDVICPPQLETTGDGGNSQAGIRVLGLVEPAKGSYVPQETSLKRSLFDVSKFPFPETEDGPAHLKPEGGKSPLRIAIGQFALQERVPPPPPLEVVVDFLPSTFDRSKIRVVSIEEAVFGIEGYMKSLDMSKSAGYYWKKLKLTRKALCYDEEGKQCIHALLRADIEKKLAIFRAGNISPVVYEETLKDEIRSKEKNDAFKTRLFASGDFTSLIIQRMYLGTFFVEATKDPVGSAIGLTINPHSREWGDLYRRLRPVDEERDVSAGDFGFYDISLKNDLMEEFKRCVTSVHPEPVMVVLIIQANFEGYHVCGMLVFLRPWGTCSGTFITAIYNSFCNWALHKKAFIAIYGPEEWRTVQLTFTGDDSLFTALKKHNKFNMQYLQDWLWRNYRMTYTSPTKTSVMTMAWTDVTYLKRKFVRGDPGVMAPLAARSMANMVKWTEDQTNEVMESVCQSVLLEAWHYGPTVYRDCYEWVKSESARLRLNPQVMDWQGMYTARLNDY